MTKYCVYIIQNPNGLLYKGLTTNIDSRLHQHNTNSGKWTSSRGPWKLVHCENFSSKSEAAKRERFFKSGIGRQILKSLISNAFDGNGG